MIKSDLSGGSRAIWPFFLSSQAHQFEPFFVSYVLCIARVQTNQDNL